MPEPQGWTLVQPAPSAQGWTLVQPAEKAAPAPPVTPPRRTLADLKAAGDADYQTRVAHAKNLFDSWVQEGPHKVWEGVQDLMAGRFALGGHRMLSGGATFAAPLALPFAAPAIMAAPGAAALTAGAGMAAQWGAPKMATALGATPDQADLAGDVAGLGAGTAMAKIGVPTLARWSTTNKAQAMGKAYQQSTRDIQAALGVSAEDVHAARPFLETVHANAVPIVGQEANGGAVDQLKKAGDLALKEIEQHVTSVIQQFPDATAPAADRAIIMKVAQMPGSSKADLAAARAVIAKYGLDEPRPLAEADSLRIRLNAENRSVLEGTGVRQRTAKLTDATYVARQQAADSLRDGIYNTLEQRGVEGIRDLRRSEGGVLAIRNAADPLTRGLRSESTVARTGETSLLRRSAQHLLRGGGAAVGAQIGGIPGAAVGAEIGQEMGAGLTSKNLSKNALLERAFRQQFTSPPVMSVQGTRAPTTAPLLQLPAGASPRSLSNVP